MEASKIDLHIFDTLLGSTALVHSNPFKFVHYTSDILYGQPCKRKAMSRMEGEYIDHPRARLLEVGGELQAL